MRIERSVVPGGCSLCGRMTVRGIATPSLVGERVVEELVVGAPPERVVDDDRCRRGRSSSARRGRTGRRARCDRRSPSSGSARPSSRRRVARIPARTSGMSNELMRSTSARGTCSPCRTERQSSSWRDQLTQAESAEPRNADTKNEELRTELRTRTPNRPELNAELNAEPERRTGTRKPRTQVVDAGLPDSRPSRWMPAFSCVSRRSLHVSRPWGYVSFSFPVLPTRSAFLVLRSSFRSQSRSEFSSEFGS